MRLVRTAATGAMVLCAACTDVTAPPTDRTLAKAALADEQLAWMTYTPPRRLHSSTPLVWDSSLGAEGECPARTGLDIVATRHFSKRRICGLVTFVRSALLHADDVAGEVQPSDAGAPAALKIFEWRDHWYVVYAMLDRKLQLTAVISPETGKVSLEYSRLRVYRTRVR